MNDIDISFISITSYIFFFSKFITFINLLKKKILDVIDMNDIDINIPKETTDNTNCLALTVRKEYRLALARNLFDKGTTLTWKIGLSIIVLNFLNMFL